MTKVTKKQKTPISQSNLNDKAANQVSNVSSTSNKKLPAPKSKSEPKSKKFINGDVSKPIKPPATQHVENNLKKHQPLEKRPIEKNPTKLETPLIIPPIGSSQKPQNKKIVFDEDYLVKSSNASKVGNNPSGNQEAWYNLLIKPDVAWYLQDKAFKSQDTPSPEFVRKCEEEGKMYFEEDTLNYEKGNKFLLNQLFIVLNIFFY